MKIRIISLIGAAIIPFLNGCVSGPTALRPVGPDVTSSVGSTRQGTLLVYTASQIDEDFSRGYYLQLTGYEIKDASGKRLAFVNNQNSDADGPPDRMPLPAGTYNIVGESADYGLVTVSVVIQSGRTTTVHLDRDSRTPLPYSPKSLVPLSAGKTVGWNDASASETW
jgi:hypothetical protein